VIGEELNHDLSVGLADTPREEDQLPDQELCLPRARADHAEKVRG
jgi:hypothetical protein